MDSNFKNFQLYSGFQHHLLPEATHAIKKVGARNSSQSLAIFWPVSIYGWPKFLLVSQTYCTCSLRGLYLTYKKSPIFKKWPTYFWSLFLPLRVHYKHVLWHYHCYGLFLHFGVILHEIVMYNVSGISIFTSTYMVCDETFKAGNFLSFSLNLLWNIHSFISVSESFLLWVKI